MKFGSTRTSSFSKQPMIILGSTVVVEGVLVGVMADVVVGVVEPVVKGGFVVIGTSIHFPLDR